MHYLATMAVLLNERLIEYEEEQREKNRMRLG
jgi:hypothetical protein